MGFGARIFSDEYLSTQTKPRSCPVFVALSTAQPGGGSGRGIGKTMFVQWLARQCRTPQRWLWPLTFEARERLNFPSKDTLKLSSIHCPLSILVFRIPTLLQAH